MSGSFAPVPKPDLRRKRRASVSRLQVAFTRVRVHGTLISFRCFILLGQLMLEVCTVKQANDILDFLLFHHFLAQMRFGVHPNGLKDGLYIFCPGPVLRSLRRKANRSLKGFGDVHRKTFLLLKSLRA